jgi:hypothetical protein
MISSILKIPRDDIENHSRTGMAYMTYIIGGDAARIDTHLSFNEGFECLFLL